MKQLFHLFFLFILSLYFEKGYGQEVRDHKYEIFDEDNGLLSMRITSMVQDTNGYLWIGTIEGLNRFDGNRFVSFSHRKDDSTSLLFDFVQSVKTDNHGNLWCGYRQGGFSRFNEECQCFDHYSVYYENGKEKQMTAAVILAFDGDSVAWLGGKASGLNRFNLQSKKLEHFDLPFIDSGYDKVFRELSNSVLQAYKENADNMWLATANGLYLFHPKQKTFEYKKAGPIDPKYARKDCFFSIFPDESRGFWLVAAFGGISYYNRLDSSFSLFQYDIKNKDEKFGNEIVTTVEKNSLEFWVSTPDSGLAVFNLQTHKFYFPESNVENTGRYNTRKAWSLFITRDSVLFIANNFGLLKRSTDKKLFNFKKLPITAEQNADHFLIASILEDTISKCTFFGTMFANGLHILDKRTNKFSSIPVEGNPNKTNNYQMIKNVVLDKFNKIWVMTPYFIYTFDLKNNLLKKIIASDQIPGRKSNEHFKTLYKDAEGGFWLLSNLGRLYFYNSGENKISEALNKMSGAPAEIDFVGFDIYNRVWMSGDSGCYYFDQGSNKVQRLANRKLDSLLGNGIFRLLTDSKGNTWIGIKDYGLMKISYGSDRSLRFSEITKANGLPSDKLYNFNVDRNGNLWISTKIGVVYMKTDPLSFSLFNTSVGMEKNTLEMVFLNAGNNALYISTAGKYCRIDDSASNPNVPIPKVFIDNFKVLNVDKKFKVNSSDPIVLRPVDNFFSIEFGCINFNDQAFNQFAYKLEGWDQDWVYCGKRRYASYTNLNGGKYTFKVKVANSVGQWGEPVSLSILIEVPFYKKTWFIILAILFLSGIIYAIYRMRISQIEKTEMLKTEFNKKLNETKLRALRAQMNPHFIFNSLNSINRYVIKSEVKLASYYLTRFSKLMRLILDNSEHRKVVLSNELEALKLYVEMETLRFDNKFSFELILDDTVNTDRIEVPPLLIQPYVENAIWHGLLHKEGEGKLTISVTSQDNLLICEVLDNGIGREKAMEYKSKNAPTRKSIGMKLTEERLSLRETDDSENGSHEVIDLKNDTGEPIGTKVIIKIPI